jgi:hypothetical protein
MVLRRRDFSPLLNVQPGSAPHPTSYPMGTGGPFLGVKLPGREADHSSSTGAKVKNTLPYKSILPYAYMA